MGTIARRPFTVLVRDESPLTSIDDLVARSTAAPGKDKDVADRIAAIGPLVDGSMNAETVGAFLKAEGARWQAVTKELGVLPE